MSRGVGTASERGWHKFPHDSRTAAWAAAALQSAEAVLQDPAMRARWLQCEGTWFVGVDALPTAPDGSIGGVPLAGAAVETLAPLPRLHPAQLSAVFPGYPRPRKGEGTVAFGYRQRRDAAHVDGLLAEGPERRRYIREPHAWILGLPLNRSEPEASPLAVWDGSHKVMARAFRAACAGTPPDRLAETDVTDAYQTARRDVFETCPRVLLSAQPGEAILLHPMTLHGISPWCAGTGPPRMVAYFRPPMPGGVEAWLQN